METLGLQIGGPSEIRRLSGTVGRQETMTQPVVRKRLDMQPGPGDVQSGLTGMVSDNLREWCPPVEPTEQRHPTLVSPDPMRSRRIEGDRVGPEMVHRIGRGAEYGFVFNGSGHSVASVGRGVSTRGFS